MSFKNRYQPHLLSPELHSPILLSQPCIWDFGTPFSSTYPLLNRVFGTPSSSPQPSLEHTLTFPYPLLNRVFSTPFSSPQLYLWHTLTCPYPLLNPVFDTPLHVLSDDPPCLWHTLTIPYPLLSPVFDTPLPVLILSSTLSLTPPPVLILSSTLSLTPTYLVLILIHHYLVFTCFPFFRWRQFLCGWDPTVQRCLWRTHTDQGRGLLCGAGHQVSPPLIQLPCST